MKLRHCIIPSIKSLSVSSWLLLTVVPLVVLAIGAFSSTDNSKSFMEFCSYSMYFQCFGLSFLIALVAVVLGYIPAKLFGNVNKPILLLLFILPLIMPRYVLYYAWSLLLSMDGMNVAANNIATSRLLQKLISTGALITWYWPLAALLISQGWRNIDKQLLDNARCEASKWKIFTKLELPMLRPSILMAFGVCFVMSMAEFTTFHLAGVETIGTRFAIMYDLSGDENLVIRAAWPLILMAFIAAGIVSVNIRSWNRGHLPSGNINKKMGWKYWFFFLLLEVFSVIVPVIILIANINSLSEFRRFIALQGDGLLWSFCIASVGAFIACFIAGGALWLNKAVKSNVFGTILSGSVFAVMFLPASITAVCLLKTMPALIRHGWAIVSMGLAMRYAGIGLVIFTLTNISANKELGQIAALDGASKINVWRYIHLPRIWPMLLGAFCLIIIFGITEIASTMILLPAGLPNYAQRLLNQMHYARDQQVIASCLLLIGVFTIGAVVLTGIFRLSAFRGFASVILMAGMLTCTGCDEEQSQQMNIISVFGQTGKGQCEFMYPRAIDISPDGYLHIVDKAGRIQRISTKGIYVSEIKTPKIDAGKPVGLKFGPDGNLYVADTHYHRVLIYNVDGELINQFGKYGEEDGSFIYPTDVAFSPDGRIYVSEYGGNDRVSVFNSQCEFLFSFGSYGQNEGQFMRPAAMEIDADNNLLYIADACNHRIAVYDFDGNLQRYFGSLGTKPGKIRYPYDICLINNKLAVCEYGNNRLQVFSLDGQSLGIYGKAGRDAGSLAYPWSVVAGNDYVYIVDSGNNRIQVWQL
ncbi:MAG: SMP-30/gluconolactonase/LRE family protein [Phycisphaerae bacterium]|nr:SMP-30/gluconolactonase/LRE family protein [Phycisphaerae bacterium]